MNHLLWPSVSTFQPNLTLLAAFGATHWTVLSTIIVKTSNEGVSLGRMVLMWSWPLIYYSPVCQFCFRLDFSINLFILSDFTSTQDTSWLVLFHVGFVTFCRTAYVCLHFSASTHCTLLSTVYRLQVSIQFVHIVHMNTQKHNHITSILTANTVSSKRHRHTHIKEA